MNTNCRLCYGPCRVMLELAPTPLANSFPDRPDKQAERFPNNLIECIYCGHVQQQYRADINWTDYRYRTPEANRRHLAAAADELRRRYPEARTVLEIGSNNGLYLEELKKVGFQALGVDPNATIGVAAPFTSALAEKLGVVDVVVANNVLAHVDDLCDVFRGIDKVLGDEGVLVFEVQDFYSMAHRGAFDMIYHEHRDYHKSAALEPFLRRWGLVITDTETLMTHGGSMRYWCERPPLWRDFAKKIKDAKQAVQEQLIGIDGVVACFGATAKACTLIHHFGLADAIHYCVDSTPEKHGRYIPGTNICIHPICTLQEAVPEAVILTAWNFKDVILEKYQHLKLNWIIPFEEVVCR